MAGSKILTGKRISSSTVMEVIIAMVILMIAFGLGMLIFINITRSSSAIKKIRAEAALKAALLQAERSKDEILPSQIQMGDFSITQEKKPYHDEKELVQLVLIAYDRNGQQITDLQKIVSDNDIQP